MPLHPAAPVRTGAPGHLRMHFAAAMWQAAELEELASSLATDSNKGSQAGGNGGEPDVNSNVDNSQAGGFFAWMGRDPTVKPARGVHAGVHLGVRAVAGGSE